MILQTWQTFGTSSVPSGGHPTLKVGNTDSHTFFNLPGVNFTVLFSENLSEIFDHSVKDCGFTVP